MIVNYFHEVHLHAGPVLLLSVSRRDYWIIKARSGIRQQIWKCLICHRVRDKTAVQIMSDLPLPRVIPSSVFSHVEIDFVKLNLDIVEESKLLNIIFVYSSDSLLKLSILN